MSEFLGHYSELINCIIFTSIFLSSASTAALLLFSHASTADNFLYALFNFDPLLAIVKYIKQTKL